MEIHELARKMKDAPDYFPRQKLKEESKDMLDHWGKEDQLNVAMEECAELIQAISKARRYGADHPSVYLNLVEEIGDVTIILEHLKTIYGITQEEINKSIHVKIKRAYDKVNKDMELKNNQTN